MAKRHPVQILIFLIFTSCLWASSNLHEFVQLITEQSLTDHFYRISDPLWDPLNFHQGKTREEGTSGHDSVVAYLQNQLMSCFGEEYVYIHEFPWEDGTNGKGRNVIGVKPGQPGDSSRVWVVGAHYDSYDMNRTSFAPGANDNGSGIAGVLEMARVINMRESDATIVFAFWDAEEPRYATHSWVNASSFGSSAYSGPSGSRAWVNDHFSQQIDSIGSNELLWDRIEGYINLDMFGYPGIDNTVWIYHGGSGWNDQINDEEIYYPTTESVNGLYLSAQQYLSTYGYDDREPENHLTVIGKGTMTYSDNTSFSRAGIASLEYAESDWNNDPHYHQWSDYYRPSGGDGNFSDENPNINFMTMVVRGALALLADTAGVNISSDIPTPVELLDLQALSDRDCVRLTWSTASETENLGFLIERRTGGNAEWKMISGYLTDHELTGAGYSTGMIDYMYCDNNVIPDKRYEYRLSDVDFQGTVNCLRSTSVIYKDTENISKSRLYPNPFNPSVAIQYEVGEDARVHINIFDARGRKIETLINGQTQPRGTYELVWNAGDKTSGVYLIQICLDFGDRTRSMHVVKAILKK